uniref:Uncharacterized protein n=1 Tax=Trichuris muris TaxID=70415 RepID=A0A5S6QY88_TRIMR
MVTSAICNYLPLYMLVVACTTVFLITLCGHRKRTAEDKRHQEQFTKEMERIQQMHKDLHARLEKERMERVLDLTATTSEILKAKYYNKVSKQAALDAVRVESRLQGNKSAAASTETARTSSTSANIRAGSSSRLMSGSSDAVKEVMATDDKNLKNSRVSESENLERKRSNKPAEAKDQSKKQQTSNEKSDRLEESVKSIPSPSEHSSQIKSMQENSDEKSEEDEKEEDGEQ